jgi:hypothetical protein
MFMPAINGHDLIGLFGVLGDEVGDAMDQRMRQALLDVAGAPLVALAVVTRCALGLLGNLDQAFARVGAAIEHHVFDPLAQVGFELVVDTHHAGVDDAHVHPRLDGVVQEHGVDRLAHRVVATK